MIFSKAKIFALVILIAGAIFFLTRKEGPSQGSSTTAEISADQNASGANGPTTTTAHDEKKSTTDLSMEAVDPQSQQQLKTLEEILASHNDNDPRMDSELRVLSENAKHLLQKKYHALPAENRNDRGTIVFLLGRNLKTANDFAFFKDVLNETPCLSLSDCSKAEPPMANAEQSEHQGGFAVALAYPQMMALQALEKQLGSSQSENAKDLVAEAKHSRVPEVAKYAEKIELKSQK
jgi:hypothetical protein